MVTKTVPIDKSDERIERMFASIAHRYDLMNHLLSCNIDKYWRRRTVRLVPPEAIGPILDVCTGTGDLALEYYRARQRGFGIGSPQSEAAAEQAAADGPCVIATDFCPQMLEVARGKQRRLGIGTDQLQFLQADTQRLPFPADQFQIVAVAFGLRNVAETDRGLAEMVRVCQPDGRVAVLEFSLPERQPWRGIYRFYFRRVLPRIGQWFARNDHAAYEYLPASVGQFPSGEAMASRMRQAGLTNVQYYPMTLGVATLYVGRKPNADSPAEQAARCP